jgi:hypothetical protein
MTICDGGRRRLVMDVYISNYAPRLLPDVRLGSDEQLCSPSAATTPQVKTTERFMIDLVKA